MSMKTISQKRSTYNYRIRLTVHHCTKDNIDLYYQAFSLLPNSDVKNSGLVSCSNPLKSGAVGSTHNSVNIKSDKLLIKF